MTNTIADKKSYTTFCNGTKQMALLNIICITLIFLITVTLAPLHAQLKLYTVPKALSSSLHHATSNVKNAARIQDDTPLQLPFWDDFSTYSLDVNGLPTVNKALWINSQSVWLNSGMGINEPTVNVVTFDGLDSANLPYNPTQIFVSGFSDKLISKPIDLGSPAVDESHKDAVYLSFFYQWMGNGEAPDKNDFLLLEFKDKTNKWQEVQRMTPGDTPDRTLFIYSIVKVEASFLHSAFQFRFKNYGRESGPFDTWNLDYVYLNKNRTAKDISFPDRAIASDVSSPFQRYRSVPLNHFFDRRPIDTITFDVKNLQNQTSFNAINYSISAKIKKYKTSSVPTVSNIAITAATTITPSGSGGGLIEPLGRVKVNVVKHLNRSDKNQFDSLDTGVEIQLKINITSDDNDDPARGPFLPTDTRIPKDFTVNDTITSFYNLKDYYAYDDGVAEYSVGLTQPGNFAACEFNTLTTNPDTLTGFDVYFPDFAIATNLSTRFYVFDDASGIPGAALRQPSVTIQKNGLNKFKRVPIPPTIVPLKFYIGWVETSANPVKVGLDRNNDTGDKIFVKVNGTWTPNTIVHGTLMIRPVFGKSGLITALPEKKPHLAIYPNPTSGIFFVQGNYDPVKIINTTGQSIQYTFEQFGDEKKITLQTTPGLYILQLQKGTSVEVRKIIVR